MEEKKPSGEDKDITMKMDDQQEKFRYRSNSSPSLELALLCQSEPEQAPRIRVEVGESGPVLKVHYPTQQSLLETYTQHIQLGGMSFPIEADFSIGTGIYVHLIPPHEDRGVLIKGSVSWVAEGCGIAVDFEDIQRGYFSVMWDSYAKAQLEEGVISTPMQLPVAHLYTPNSLEAPIEELEDGSIRFLTETPPRVES